MIRTAIFVLCAAILAGCSGAAVAPPAPAAEPAVQSNVVLTEASDGDAVPLKVIQNLPRGVSATTVTEDETGCFYYRAGNGAMSVTDANGFAVCRG